MTAMQIPACIAEIISYKPNENSEIKITTKGMFYLSEKDNVLVFILDTMDEEYYAEFVDENPDYFPENIRLNILNTAVSQQTVSYFSNFTSNKF